MSDGSSIGFTNIRRRVSKAVRKHEAKDRYGINMGYLEPMETGIEALDSHRLERFVRSTLYKMLDAEQGKGWRCWQEASDVDPIALKQIRVNNLCQPNRSWKQKTGGRRILMMAEMGGTIKKAETLGAEANAFFGRWANISI